MDKGRGPGGRMSTRREKVGELELRFDHGAQFFTARDPLFASEVAKWVEQGVVHPWNGRFATLENGLATPMTPSVQKFVAVPTMSALPKALAEGLDVRYGVRPMVIERTTAGYTVTGEKGEALGTFARVVLAVPDEQARPFGRQLGLDVPETTTVPCWAVMVAFERAVDVTCDAANVIGSPLAWVAREASKPGRAGIQMLSGLDAWVLHASAEWSAAHLEETPEAVATRLLEAFATATGQPLPPTRLLKAHRWRFAKTTVAASGPGYVWDSKHNAGACGDWLIEGKVQGAFLSGARLAKAILG